MKTTVLLLAGLLLGGVAGAQQTGYPITPVPFTATHVTGGFWKQRLDACRDVTVPLAFSTRGWKAISTVC